MSRNVELESAIKYTISNPTRYNGFLRVAANNFRLSTANQLFVYYQKEDADIVLDAGRWEKLFGRIVADNAQKIRIVQTGKTGKPQWTTYYDIADTIVTDDSKPVMRATVAQDVSMEQIREIAEKKMLLASSQIEDYMAANGIIAPAERIIGFIKDSIISEVAIKCGQEPLLYYEQINDFRKWALKDERIFKVFSAFFHNISNEMVNELSATQQRENDIETERTGGNRSDNTRGIEGEGSSAGTDGERRRGIAGINHRTEIISGKVREAEAGILGESEPSTNNDLGRVPVGADSISESSSAASVTNEAADDETAHHEKGDNGGIETSESDVVGSKNDNGAERSGGSNSPRSDLHRIEQTIELADYSEEEQDELLNQVLCASKDLKYKIYFTYERQLRDEKMSAADFAKFIANAYGTGGAYAFQSKSDMLSSGVLEKGDIILMLPTTATASDRDTHIGFFWGNSSSEDNMWHSIGSNNHISTITPKTSPSYYVVIKYAPSEYTLTLNKTSSNVSITNGDSGYSLAGAVYKIYNSSGTEVASITTNSSGKGSSNVKLKNGTYTAVESKAPPGYALDTTRHTVRINNADATLNVSDVPLIKTVTLTKTSANTSITAGNSNYSLAGAVYDVYEGNSATGTPVASFTTNSSGVATLSRKLYPNRTYTILERTPPPGYVKDTTPHPFYLTYNSATMDVVDDPTTIRLTVKKKDSETNTSVAQGNASLAGAQYKVTYVNGTKTVENIVTTNSSGSATLRGLPIGVTVTVQEITAPAGYKLDSRVHTYVTTTKTEKIEYDLEPEDFTEDVFKGHIQITKQIEMLGADAQLEQGAEYQVYLKSAGSYNAAKDAERDYLVTGADGKATTKDLPYGTYTLHQVKGVPGREFKDMDVDVHENGKTYEVTLTNELKYAPFKIIKTSEDGNVEGFTFKVTRLADGASATYTTNAAGEIITSQFPVYVDANATQKFEYKIEEINVPDKYRTPDAQTVTLTYGQTAEVSFYNQIARGSLEILKVDHDGVTPLEGAKFEITDDNGNVIATETSGPDGKIKVESILYGQYHWSEVMAPKGYELDDTVHDFAIEHDEQIVEVTQENTPSVGSITAKKIDADGNAMPGVEFTLEYSTDDGATWAPVEARAEDSKPSIGGCTSAVVDGALETDENGVATFNGLQINNQTVTILYRLTETATKSGNTLLAAPMFIGSLPQVLDDGTEIVDVTVTAVNNQNYTLPSSGGNGMVSVPVGIALALISVSCFAAWLWKKKLF